MFERGMERERCVRFIGWGQERIGRTITEGVEVRKVLTLTQPHSPPLRATKTPGEAGGEGTF